HYFVTKPDIYTIFPQTNTMCWIADVNRTDTITIIDSTLCGVDSCNFVMTSLINRPPEIASVASIDTAFCHAATLCVDYDVSDPDGNIDTVLVSGTCPNAVLDIVNSRVCLELADAVECELRLIVLDDCGLADTALVQIIAVPNRPPNVNLPSIETVVRCETDTSAIVIADICVTDPDYDEVTLALDSGLGEFAFDPLYDCGELTFMPPTNDTAEYCFKFMATDFCDTVYELFCINVLPSAVCSTCVEVAIEGPPCVNSGGQAIVNITAETFNKIGGYDLLVGYDASALNFVHADLGLDVSGWEYFTYRFGDLGNCEAPCPSGLLKLVAIADINNGPFHPPQEQLSPMGTIAAITFRVSSDLNFGGQRVPVRFFWMGCSDNGFSDPTGQYFYVDYIIFSPEGNIVWDEFNDDVYPDEDRPPHIGAPDSCLVGDKYTPVRCVSFHNGEVCIQHPDSIDKRGDMNLNGVQYEIADAVVYTNYFISGLSAFSISVAGQIAASDVNADGITLSIGDLVYLIRVIVGDAPPYPKPRIEDEVLAATCTQRAGEASVRIESTGDIGGVLMVFDGENIESVIPTPGDDAGNMEMKYGWLAGNLRVLLYSMKPGGKIPSGTAELVRLQLPADGTVELVEIEMADYYGRELTTAVSNPALPKELHLSQNRPNPFNPNTTFELALPKASEYTLTIYNIMGQVIRRWAGYSEAGYISFEWDGRDQNSEPVASGIYFYRAEALGQDSIRKMILLK
ncbi:MAG: FlgD immunoglobulin-like domain containing protein, partial [Candidatus Thorarchaeota archaeon]